MKVSLVMATIGRIKEVNEFLEALLHQTYQNFELIIVDQNELPVLQPTIEGYQNLLPIKYIRSQKQGLSLARNIGIAEAIGDIISFPDDDCLYPPDLLEKMVTVLGTNDEIAAISTSWYDTNTLTKLKNFGNKEEYITDVTIWTQVSSITLFIKAEVLDEVGKFDETLGIGPNSTWKGAEDKDLPIRILRSGKKILYSPSLFVLHPVPTQNATTNEEAKKVLHKNFQYSAAAGFVMRKHRYPVHLMFASILVIFGKLLINCFTFNIFGCKLRWASLKGRIYGLAHSEERGL